MYTEDFGQVLSLLPPRDEQDRIVIFLDQRTAEIDAAIAKKERLIDLMKTLQKMQISRSVTIGLNPGVALKDSGGIAIGLIPAHWESRRLKHAVQRIYDCKNRTPDYFPNGDYFVIRTTNVKKGRLEMEGALYTDAKGFAEWTKKGLPKAGELVITREAPAGEVAQLPPGFVGCLGQRMMGIVPDNQQVLSKYLLYFLQSDAFDQYVSLHGSGSTVAHLRVGQVYDIPLAFPPSLLEQQEIVDFLEREQLRIDRVVQQEVKAIKVLRELKAVTIASTVCGKIKV
jgi:type I restriction enzyme S subunit